MYEGAATHEWVAKAKQNVKWLIILGIAQVVLGMIAIASPLMTGIVVSIFVGACLLACGVGRVIEAFKAGSWGAGLLGTAVGALTIIAGLLMLFRPGVGLVTLTLILAFYFLIEGISTAVVAWKMRPNDGWGWVMFQGIVSILLGFMIWRQWPLSGAWALGTIIGIHILLNGWTMIMLGMALKRGGGAVREAVTGEG